MAPPLTAPLAKVDAGAVVDAELAAAIAAGRILVTPRTYNIATPAAGADFAIAVPGGVTWIPLSLLATFATSAVAANRVTRLRVGDGTTNYWVSGWNIAITAAITNSYCWVRNAGVLSGVVNTGTMISGLPNFPLVGGEQVSSVTAGIQGGDQWSTAAIRVLELRYRTARELEQYAQALAAGEHPDEYPGLLSAL